MRNPGLGAGRRRAVTSVSIAAALILLGAFAWLAAASVHGSAVPAWDRGVTEAFAGWRTPGRSHVFWAATLLGNNPVLAALSASAVLLFAVWGRRAQAALVAVGLVVAWGLSEGAKGLLGRARPPAAEALIAMPSSHSMPSGHALTTLVFLGLLVFIAWRAARRGAVPGPLDGDRVAAGSFWPAAATAVAVVVAAIIGVSRVYLGVHWLSDIVGGWCLGGAWLAGLLLGVHVWIAAEARGRAATGTRGRAAAFLARRPAAPAWVRSTAVGVVVAVCGAVVVLAAGWDPLLAELR